MSGKQPVGPRPITRADGTTAYSTGAVHTWLIRLADRRRAQTATDPGTDLVPDTRARPVSYISEFEQRWRAYAADNR